MIAVTSNCILKDSVFHMLLSAVFCCELQQTEHKTRHNTSVWFTFRRLVLQDSHLILDAFNLVFVGLQHY